MKRFVLLLMAIVLSLFLFACNECDHEWSDATCTEPKTCTLCGETDGDAKGHAYGEWTESKAPSCYETGEKTRSCSCGATETDITPTLPHSYDHDCDNTCNTDGCETTRVTEHVYDHNCDTSCSTVGCGYIRQTEHVYDHDCDNTCNTDGCGFTRQIQHVYSHDCDTSCNTVGCGFTRQTTHVYDNACDTTCNTVGCGYVRDAEHVFDHNCDTSCNTVGCGYTREIQHDFDHNCDSTCNTVGCGFTRNTQHDFDHNCDTSCNTVGCGYTREIQHDFDHNCDTSCNTVGCGYTRVIQHDFDHNCDNKCNTVGCGYTRTTRHVYDHNCDNKCNTVGCGYTRVIQHNFDHNCDKLCNTVGCGFTRQTTHVYDNACDTTCNTVGCGATREPPHDFDDVCDATCNNAECGFTREAPHDYVSEVTLPTCEAGGYTTHTCSVCRKTYVDNEVGAHGHAYGDWFVSTKITSANSNGEMSRNCLNCMKPEKKPIAVLHSGNMGGYLPTDPVNKNTITDAVQWKLYEDGTLKLEGTGVTAEANWDGSTQPYKAYRDQIKRAIVGEGITYIRGGAFAYMQNLEEYELPSTLYHLTGNTFMQSFKKGITEFTVPANVTYLGICIAGPYTSNVTNTALFNDIYIENPNVTFHPKSPNKGNGELYISFNSYVKYNPNLTIYSHGTSNNVKTYCDTYGIRYVDLDSSVFGEVDNLKYSVLEGKMLLSAKDPSKPVTLPASQPWVTKLEKSTITTIEIAANITDIPASYFKDYVSLTSVTLPATVQTIGSEAFATTSAISTALTIQLYDALTAVSSDFLKNRTEVTVNGIFGTVLDNFKQTGVTLNLKKSIKILLIGNSLSQDAADYTSNNKPSQLYNIIKSMTGPNCYVKIGALCAGAKTAGWHATMAESNAPEYLFSVISDDTNGLWTSTSGVSSIQALTSDKWDYITIQPYASEAVTGTGSKADTDTKYEPAKAEKFYALSASLPYLLDHFDKYCPDAKIYYYLTWSNYYNASWTSSSNLALNGAEDEFINKRLPVARTAMNYKGTNSGKGFDGLIAGGTAIQIARSTYLGTQFYTTYNNPPAANKPDTTSWIGLQRDDVHLSFSTGRYIVGLAFAEILVPEEYRLDTYTLPDIAPTVNGELPKHHTTLAQLCVAKMLETSQLEGNDKYKVVRLEGYTVEPTN